MRTRTVRVEVTPSDIEDGLPDESELCAIAIAVNRATGNGDAFVMKHHIRFRDGTTSRIPEDATKFVDVFDWWRNVPLVGCCICWLFAPRPFDLKVPDAA